MSIKHIVYPTISKPVTVKGIPLIWWVFTILFSGTSSVVFSFFMDGWGYLAGVLILLICWVFGFVYSRNDPDFASVWFQKRISLPDTKNLSNKNTRRYEP
jgi:type IV secretory pathway VirB3-like protein